RWREPRRSQPGCRESRRARGSRTRAGRRSRARARGRRRTSGRNPIKLREMRHDPQVSRPDAIEALSSTRFDLLAIGGGILGSAVAAHAARLGLSVALVDAGDFGGATSSASSKLVHGGLRYLRLGDVRLVREAHHERRTLTRLVAPRLVHRVPFLFPLYEDGP